MSIRDFFTGTKLDDTLLIGYYGGGNFGDELLLEVLLNLLRQQGAERVAVRFQGGDYARMHRDFGYRVVDGSDRQALLRAIRRSRHIFVGGGGHWGLDANLSVLLLGIVLWVARYVLHKQVHIIGVGYYDSSNLFGRISAYLSGKAATTLIVRDEQSVRNFRRFRPNVDLDQDIAFRIPDVDLQPYEPLPAELALLGDWADDGTVLVVLRKFNNPSFAGYNRRVAQFVASQRRKVIIGLLQRPEEYPEGQALIDDLVSTHPNVRTFDPIINPLSLVQFLRVHGPKLTIIAPQFHLQLVAIIYGLRFMPMVYDDKVSELLLQHGYTDDDLLPISKLTAEDFTRYVDTVPQG